MPVLPILIPAYQPGMPFVRLISELVRGNSQPIIVVDDGSGPEFEHFFAMVSANPGVHVVPHAINLGKGAALKTGINHILCAFPECVGIVTADADGQHDPNDVARVALRLTREPESLVLGVRRFDAGAPLRSRLGNIVTRRVVRILTGQKLSDTQTGLRGIPRGLLVYLLQTSTSGYEFETDMLIACKHRRQKIVEEPIRTIYEEGNSSSHFNPILDSMRIYFVLLRFGLLAAMTAVIDNVAFFSTFRLTGSIAEAQLTGRLLAMTFNYTGARRAVFHSGQRHLEVLPKYILLVCANGLASYALIYFLHSTFKIAVIPAKLAAEAGLFIANFAIQRDFVFTRRSQTNSVNRATDWDSYYRSVPATARLTRKYTSAVLLRWMNRCIRSGASVIEIGGANSCFLDRIMLEIRPAAYHVVDTNEYGLSLLRDREDASRAVHLHCQNVLDLAMDTRADLVFSVGLIEHFDRASTKRAILAHFDLLKPGGHAIITFPTPTFLYRIARFALECLGLWKFPDERPLERDEVVDTILERAEVVHEQLLLPLILTQRVVVAKLRAPLQSRATS